MQFLEEVPLAPYTTFQIGGPARWFAEAASEDDIAAGIAFAGERQLPLFVLGGGSNLLVSDAGFSRARPAHRFAAASNPPRRVAMRSSPPRPEKTGMGLSPTPSPQDYAGVECLSGIPGTVGGTPVQNVGAYGQEVSQTIVRVRAFDRRTAQFVNLPASACGFSYRRSIFNTTERERYVVSRVDYALRKDASGQLCLRGRGQVLCRPQRGVAYAGRGSRSCAQHPRPEGNAAGARRPGLPQRG